MDLLSKFKDAASMFWDALDVQEKMIVGYLASSLLLSVYARAAKIREEHLLARLREELTHAD
jgi:hypothetical protein